MCKQRAHMQTLADLAKIREVVEQKMIAFNKGQLVKMQGIAQPQILTGAVASPPLKQPHHSGQQQPPIVGARVPNTSVSKAEIGTKVPHPTSSPQGGAQSRHILQSGPPYEASLVSGTNCYCRERSLIEFVEC